MSRCCGGVCGIVMICCVVLFFFLKFGGRLLRLFGVFDECCVGGC